MGDALVSELFSTKRAAEILQRTSFCIWYHCTRNLAPHRLEPVWVEGRLFLTKEMLRALVENNHLRPKPGETQEEILARVENATPG
jgi:hypothetical protein